jgi:uncharacterized membrane protein YcaP (DUF421 family)
LEGAPVFDLGSIVWPADGGLELVVHLVIRAGVVYLFVLVAMRFFGKREVGQFTMPDLVLVLLAANALQPAITGPDSSLGGALVILATLFALNWIVAWLRVRSSLADWFVSPSPAVLYSAPDAAPPISALPATPAELQRWKREGLTPKDVAEALHEAGVERLDQVGRIWLEESGRLMVIAKPDPAIVCRHPAP